MKIENNRRLDVWSKRAIMVIVLLMCLFLIAGTIHTWFSFRPRADRISEELQQMNDKMDEILEGLEAQHDD